MAERGKTASARAYSGPSVKDKLTERIRAAAFGSKADIQCSDRVFLLLTHSVIG